MSIPKCKKQQLSLISTADQRLTPRRCLRYRKIFGLLWARS